MPVPDTTKRNPFPQSYRCERHGLWLVEREAATGNWRVAQGPDQAPWTVAAERPLCLFCGDDLQPVERSDARLAAPPAATG